MKNKGFNLPRVIPYLSAILIASACTKEDSLVDTTSVNNSLSESVQPVEALATTSSLSTLRIEAENYTNMQGVILDPCSEGGKNVGGIQAGEWMDYSVNIPASDSYKMNFRVAGPGGQFQVRNASGTVLATITTPKTGGYQVYTTVSANVNLTAGQQTIRLYAVTGGYNINWFEIVGGASSVESDNTAASESSSGSTSISSNILYREAFEGSSVWAGSLGKEWNTSYGFSVVTNPVREGAKAGRFELRDGDADAYPRSEVRWPSSFNGTNRWMSFSVYWPSNGMQPDREHEIFHQTHQTSKTSPPMCLMIKNDHIWAQINGQVFSGVLGTPDGSKAFDLGQVPKDKWVRFVVRYRFSYGSDGVWQIWMNGQQVLNYSGKNIYPPSITTNLPSFKLGIYKYPWKGSGTSDAKLRIMYVDDVRIGNEKSTFSTM